jgi:hypothetical protein
MLHVSGFFHCLPFLTIDFFRSPSAVTSIPTMRGIFKCLFNNTMSKLTSKLVEKISTFHVTIACIYSYIRLFRRLAARESIYSVRRKVQSKQRKILFQFNFLFRIFIRPTLKFWTGFGLFLVYCGIVWLSHC